MDKRVDEIFKQEMQGDTSFTEPTGMLNMFFGSNKYSQKEMRSVWQTGIRHGIEIGLRRASIEGQIIELNQNTIDDKHKEFLKKFYELANDYKCGVKYHPFKGMIVVDLS